MGIEASLPDPLRTFPRVNARIHVPGSDFLLPYWKPFGRFVSHPSEADFILALNDFTPGAAQALSALKRWRKPIAWWTIEDPNSFELFLPQALAADVVFTTDEACIPRYRHHLGHDRIHWLPLAACPDFHHPLESSPEATDLVISANWYPNSARQWAVDTVVRPLTRSGYSLSLFCYQDFMWPAEYHRYWKGHTSCRTVSEQYRYGRVVLGLNNQRSGFDGHPHTVMTSMRTFEALACAKPFLSAHSDAYSHLGFINGEHMIWVETPEQALSAAELLLSAQGSRIANAGREYVLDHHTYGHRLVSIAQYVLG